MESDPISREPRTAGTNEKRIGEWRDEDGYEPWLGGLGDYIEVPASSQITSQKKC